MESPSKKQKVVKHSSKSPKLVNESQSVSTDLIDVAKITPRGKKKSQAHNPHQGICAQCISADTCTYPRPTDRPVLMCDEFEGYPMRAAGKVSPIQESKVAVGSDGVISLYRGLCSTCEKRDGCDFPKPEGGVWHCEEYE